MKNEPGKIAASAGRNAPTGGKPSILIVDDERNTREGLAMALRREWNVRTAESKDAALARLAEAPADVMLSDVRMPGGSGLELLEAAHKAYPRMACVLLTAYGSVETAVEAMKLGAADFLTKPVNLDQLDIVLARTLRTRALERENRELKKRLDARYGLENIVGSAPAMERVFDIVRQAAPSMATVLVEGPSGTGKELVAQAIHHLSPRAAGPFVAVHCAALSPTLLESELFGHEKGAFTGAVAQTRGRFEQASGGTLFLDEVGEIAPEVQVKLLRVLETRTFERVGGSETLRADFRIVAATNRDLKAVVAAGRFRKDLYYRLAVVLVRMPTIYTFFALRISSTALSKLGWSISSSVACRLWISARSTALSTSCVGMVLSACSMRSTLVRRPRTTSCRAFFMPGYPRYPSSAAKRTTVDSLTPTAAPMRAAVMNAALS